MPFSPNSVPLTPINFLERAATVYSDCPALVYTTNNNRVTSYTWDQTHHRCVMTASSIKSLGIKQGDVVSVLAPNIPAMYELQFSVPMAGAIVNNINTRLDPHMLSVLLRHSESKLIFVDQHLHQLLLRGLSLFPPGTPHPLVIIIRDTDDMNEKNITDGSNIVADYKQLVEGGNPGFEWVRLRANGMQSLLTTPPEPLTPPKV